ncbi:hypothetical protein HQ531_11355 [bacterium]|nr:hypothetical protein [bacterium]
MSENEVKGYSIWLIPDQKSKEMLNEIATDLRRQLNGQPLQPHLTLLGQITEELEHIRPLFRNLGHASRKLDLLVESIAYEDVFFRSLYLKTVMSSRLFDMNQAARSSFQREADPPFSPHISLLYSFASEAEKRVFHEQILNLHIGIISISDIDLVQTQGEVSNWKLIERIHLS